MNELVVFEKKGKLYTDSRDAAEMIGKGHNNLLRDIDSYIQILENSNLSSHDFFLKSCYKVDGNKKTYPCYLLTKKGCDMVANKLTGKKGVLFTAEYINKFYTMESYIQSISEAKADFPEFTNAILGAHEEPRPYHFSNEIDMINRIVLGMSASKFKEAKGLDKSVSSIRPYLTAREVELIRSLQRIDIGLIVEVPDFEARKVILQSQFNRLTQKLIA